MFLLMCFFAVVLWINGKTGGEKVLDRYTEFNRLITLLAKKDGISPTLVPDVWVFKASKAQSSIPTIYQPLVCLVGQGQKLCSVGEAKFEYQVGNYFMNSLPMPVVSEIIGASTQQPFLSVALNINLIKLADMVLKIEREARVEQSNKKQSGCSCVLVGNSDESLDDAFMRLLQAATEPLAAKVLADGIIDEIYFRLLTGENGCVLRALLNQYGDIQPMSKVVAYIHENINKTMQVSELASIANMSKTSFFNAFKRLMHVPPNQYIKSTKLQKAQVLLTQGMQANEASYQVGYGSFSQFSREYKRFFGYTPSQTKVA